MRVVSFGEGPAAAICDLRWIDPYQFTSWTANLIEIAIYPIDFGHWIPSTIWENAYIYTILSYVLLYLVKNVWTKDKWGNGRRSFFPITKCLLWIHHCPDMSFHIWNSFISFNYPWPMLYLSVCTLYQAYYYLYQPVRICWVPVLYFSWIPKSTDLITIILRPVIRHHIFFDYKTFLNKTC